MQAVAAVWVVAVLALLTQAAAHQFKFGRCKKGSSMANFEPSRFNGTWFVHSKLATSSECLMATFDWDEDNNMFNVREGLLPTLAAIAPFDIYINNAGVLTQTDSANPATMKLVWEGVVADLLPYTYTVVDTDYDNYALCVECQSLMGMAMRVSASVLTRSQTPPTKEEMDGYLAKLAAEPNVNLSKMSSIQQSTCRSPDDVTYNILYDDKGFSLMSLSGNDELRKISTVTGVEEYVNETVEKEEQKQN